ncbi:MAG: ABC transporter ATP-binding protein [Thermodesulforhabdaceae bacterium]
MCGVLEARKLTIGYRSAKGRKFVVADEIEASLKAGEFVCLLGPNGAGKSTLIKTLAGINRPLSGEVLIDGMPISAISSRELARRLSVVLTDKPAIGLMTVFSVVALGRYPYTGWTGSLSPRDEEIVWEAIKAVGIEELSNRLVSELSDGERQKVMIARALAQQPRVMILDEATAFLDLPRRVELVLLLRRLAHESNIAVLLSTHDLDLALRGADRLWILPKGETLIDGIPEDLVLKGAFASAFNGSNVIFDCHSGTFVFESPYLGEVACEGNGVFGVWTRRALSRAGYKVVSREKAFLRVEVSDEKGSEALWRIYCGEHPERFARSLEELLLHLNSIRDAA